MSVDARRCGLTGSDILSVAQFNPDNVAPLFDLADSMRDAVRRHGGTDRLRNRVLAALFYEPSTRTSASFIAAMERLGGGVIPITQGVQFSSVAKGESLPDTIRTLEQYADTIVLRHPVVGSAREAAEAASIPIVNAGDGAGEHPTQALLDLYTIRDELGSLDGLHVAMVGDLRFGRTVHSLTRLLMQYDVKLSFVSPEILRLPLDLMNEVREAGLAVRETYGIADVIGDVEVLYMTRVQKERFTDLSGYEDVEDFYVLTPELMERARDRMIVMHPLPRLAEIATEVDRDPRAAYFRQVQNGMFVRMALLAAVLDAE